VNAHDLWERLKREDEIEIANFRVIATVLSGVLNLAVIVFVGWVIGNGWHAVAQSGIQADIAIQRHYCSVVSYNAFQCHQASLAVRHDKDRQFLASHTGLFIGIYLFITLLFARMYWMWWSYGSNETSQAHEVLAHTLNQHGPVYSDFRFCADRTSFFGGSCDVAYLILRQLNLPPDAGRLDGMHGERRSSEWMNAPTEV